MRGEGTHRLAPHELRSIVEYQGEILSQTQLSSALSGLSDRQVLRTHVKLFVRQCGTPTEAAGLVVTHAINPNDVREKVRTAMAACGGRADESLLSRLGLGCLSNSTYPNRDMRLAVRGQELKGRNLRQLGEGAVRIRSHVLESREQRCGALLARVGEAQVLLQQVQRVCLPG